MLDVDGGATIPLGDFEEGAGTGEGAEAGPVFAVGFVLPRSDRFALLLGFHQARFGCEAAGCASDGRYVATGFDAGLRLALLAGRAAVPWLSLGGVTTRVEARDLPAPNGGVSKLGWGLKAGAGIWWGNEWIAVQPKVAWTRVDTELPGGDTLEMRYLSATLGVSFPF